MPEFPIPIDAPVGAKGAPKRAADETRRQYGISLARTGGLSSLTLLPTAPCGNGPQLLGRDPLLAEMVQKTQAK